MTAPCEVKLTLERKALERGVTIVGLHSWIVEDDTVYVIYDITPDLDGLGLHFSFPFPEQVTRDELRRFSEWLAEFGYQTMH
jgi:hypothetical protein